jgi:phosphoenolpyruvate carboxykinase (ATP)
MELDLAGVKKYLEAPFQGTAEIEDVKQLAGKATGGAPFLPLPPSIYAQLLGEKIRKHKIHCWLVNTGWTGGAHDVGERIQIAHTRAMIREALKGALEDVPTQEDPVFRLRFPISCEGVPEEILNPRSTWRNAKEYDVAALRLAEKFEKNSEKFEGQALSEVKEAGPRLK